MRIFYLPINLLVLVFVLLTNLNAQIEDRHIVTTNYSDVEILQKIEQLSSLDCMKRTQETGFYYESLHEAKTFEDSLKLSISKIPYSLNRIRFDSDILVTVLPDVVNIDENNQYQIDYVSLIPILLEVVSSQQIMLNTLNLRIQDLEKQR